MKFVIPQDERRESHWSWHVEHGWGLMAVGSAPLKLFFVPAWIPDTLRSFLAHEVENDELHLGLPPISGVGRLVLVVWR
ncbi:MULTISPECIES: hypothetical protein [unclassified Mesorhizobium]|uniref:hypothetical protein n=1 Tax=unclassified Mesorhizobium TaxID=325217 RepID=UPI003014E8FD